jgi:hypothetical protein
MDTLWYWCADDTLSSYYGSSCNKGGEEDDHGVPSQKNKSKKASERDFGVII